MGKIKSKKIGGPMVNTALTTLVGVGMIGATAGMVNELPAGTAKNIAGVVPGLQALSLVSYNLPKGSKQSKQKSLYKTKNKKTLW